MNNLVKKLHSLEENIVKEKVDEETCKISLDEVPEAEKQLHHYAQTIINTTSHENYTDAQNKILDQSCHLLTLRVFLLYCKMLKAFCCIPEGSVYERMLDIRLLWFVSESTKLGRQAQKMAKLEKANAELNEGRLEQKRMELEKGQPMLYSEKSFDEYELKCFLDIVKMYPEKFPSATDQKHAKMQP